MQKAQNGRLLKCCPVFQATNPFVGVKRTLQRDRLNSPTEKIRVLGIPVSKGGIGDINLLLSDKNDDSSLTFTFVNPLACALSRQHDDYVGMLEAIDVVACDGIGMIKAARAYGLTNIRREAFDFTSQANPVFAWAAKYGKSVGFVGGKQGVAEKAALVIAQKYPGFLNAGCYSGYEQDPEQARQHFTKNQTDLVVCGMGAPLQERFLNQLVSTGWQGVGVTCGGFLDQTTKGAGYFPGWVDRLNIRFLYRLVKEPRRLWRRYLVDYQVFMRRYCQFQWQRLK